jgi:hypothetical protein
MSKSIWVLAGGNIKKNTCMYIFFCKCFQYKTRKTKIIIIVIVVINRRYLTSE